MKRKTLIGLLCLTMTLTAVPVQAEETVFSNPGTYTATGTGINGDITLTVTFSESEITDIQVDSEETATVGAAA
ncbi:MAG: hypothetical protein LIO94_00355, partial [Clostridiales bacterium]|nr:hypothetical protein [Clostridiales bacterium]